MWCDRTQRRQVLFLEGNRSTCFYAVRWGKIKLFTVDLRGQEHVTAILGAGDLFGFEAFFDDTYATSAEALTEGELCLGTGDDLRPLVDRTPALARGLARYLHRQLCRTRARQSHLCACGAQAKLAGYLLYRLTDSEDRGHQDLVVPDDLTLRDLGSVLGLSPETVCRTLSGFKASGTIEAVSSAFRIRDLADLRRLAGS
jgi:CRP/FNR family transcriptional regulator